MDLTKAIKSVLPAGFKERLRDELGVPSMGRALCAMRSNGFQPRVVLDVGAYRGEWMSLCREIWPESSVLMVEANPERAEALRKLAAAAPNLAAECALLGPVAKEDVAFYEQESASSVLPETAKTGQHFMTLPMRTLDQITEGTAFSKPDLIKLDVQGYELEILKGGAGVLGCCEAVLTEVNLIPVYAGAPLLRDVVEFLGQEGFRAYEIGDLIRRPRDRALWQLDIVFVRNGSGLVSSVSYA